MQSSVIDFPQRCTTCGNLKTFPYTWNSTVQPVMCTCVKEQSLAWECPRCKKMNAPWKGSCDCTPTPFGNLPITGGINAPTSGSTQPYTAGPNPFNHYYTDLNKNFTDK